MAFVYEAVAIAVAILQLAAGVLGPNHRIIINSIILWA